MQWIIVLRNQADSGWTNFKKAIQDESIFPFANQTIEFFHQIKNIPSWMFDRLSI